MVQLGANRYGKAEVRVMRVARAAGPGGGDVVRDWNVSTSLSGDLAATHLTGDNSAVLATDTQKNTVYAFAQELGPVAARGARDGAGRALRGQPAADHPGPGDGRGLRLEPLIGPIFGHSFARTGGLSRATPGSSTTPDRG